MANVLDGPPQIAHASSIPFTHSSVKTQTPPPGGECLERMQEM